MEEREVYYGPVKRLFSEEEIAARVRGLAGQISQDYAGRTPLLVGILKGSWIFLADLVRHLTIPVYIDFLTVASYGASTESSGVVKIVMDLKSPLTGKDVLVVEDILDTGLTMSYILNHLRLRKPESLKLCVLMDKRSRRRVPVEPDYVGFVVPDRFVVGYGVDYAERYRHLPFIGYLEGLEDEVKR